jgi:tetratricopeptide (TPR) repeat protein
MRPLALLLLLCACSSLSSDEQSRLTSYQRNAALFYEGGRFDQAIGQIERGLELAPDDYKLQAMRGAILLQTSGNAGGTDHRRLDEATKLLAELYDRRSPNRHEPYLLLDYGRALQKQGLRHLGESIRLDGEATRSTDAEASDKRTRAQQEREAATAQLQQADTVLGHLIERGDMLRIAHNHRMQIAASLGDDPKFVQEAEACLAVIKQAQEATQKRIEDTQSPAREVELLANQRQLRDEELAVRALVANFHFDRRQFEPALAQLNRILELDPRRFTDYYHRGRVLLELGRADDAKHDFRRFLADPQLLATSDRATFALKALGR